MDNPQAPQTDNAESTTDNSKTIGTIGGTKEAQAGLPGTGVDINQCGPTEGTPHNFRWVWEKTEKGELVWTDLIVCFGCGQLRRNTRNKQEVL